MRRLILLALGAAVAGIVVYRRRAMDRWEQELAIGRYGGNGSGAPSAG